ncbi:MAG: O-antigen ligase family protein [Candidatus Sungbacteria bacterium]|nr:O-antigen ligase family protein [Candidatus Sungbacteria bacterium]
MILVLLAMLSSVFYLPGLPDGFWLVKGTALSVVALAAAVVIFADWRAAYKFYPSSPPPPRFPAIALILPYFGILFLSLTWALNPWEGVSQIGLELSGLTLFLYAISRLEEKEIERVCAWFILATVVMGLWTVWAARHADTRLIPPLGNLKYLSFFILAALPLLIFFIAEEERAKKRAMGIVVLVGFIALLWYVGSRAALLIIVSALGAWILRSYLAALALFAFAVAVGVAYLTAMSDRVSLLRSTQDVIMTAPWWGVGRGNWFAYYQDYGYGGGDVRWLTLDPHNGFAQLWAECGPVALGLFLAFCVFVLSGESTRLGSALKLSFFSLLLTAFFWRTLSYPPTVMLFWILASFIWVVDDKKDRIFGATRTVAPPGALRSMEL